MDIRRLGYGVDLPRGLLEAAALGYLTDKQWDGLGQDWLERALAYVATPCRGSRAPLTRIRPRPSQLPPDERHYGLADYLEQTGRHQRYREIVPSQLWQALVNHTRNSRDANVIGNAAVRRLLYCYAIPLLRIAANGDPDAAFNLAELLAQRGDIQELRERADTGDPDAAIRLAELLAERGEIEEAIALLRRRADTSDPDTASELAHGGDVQGLRERVDTGDPDAAFELGDLLIKRGEIEEAIAVLRKGVASDRDAAILLAGVLAERGEIEEAIAVLHKRADSGDKSAARRVAELLIERGDVQRLRKRAESGDTNGASELAKLLIKRGDVQHLRKRADTSDLSAAVRLAVLLIKRGDNEQAIAVLQKCLPSGRSDARRLVEQLAQRGDVEGLRKRADTGDADACRQLAELLAQRGDVEGLRTEVLRGNVGAGLLITMVTKHSSDAGERLRRCGLNADGSIPWDTLEGTRR
jgi:thioredoxin-like negative regulator of GroEL